MAKPKKYTSKAWLFAEYTTKHRSVESLAEECGCSTNTIRTALKKAGLIK